MVPLERLPDGLAHRGSATQVDYIPAFPLTSELQYNVMRGALPGGEQGVLYHEVDLLDEATAAGTFYGQKVSLSQARPEDIISLTGITGEPIRYFKVPQTTAAVRIPQAQGPLVGFDAGRSSERVIRAAPEGEAFKSGFTLDLSFLSRRKKRRKSEEPLFQGPPAVHRARPGLHGTAGLAHRLPRASTEGGRGAGDRGPADRGSRRGSAARVPGHVRLRGADRDAATLPQAGQGARSVRGAYVPAGRAHPRDLRGEREPAAVRLGASAAALGREDRREPGRDVAGHGQPGPHRLPRDRARSRARLRGPVRVPPRLLRPARAGGGRTA